MTEEEKLQIFNDNKALIYSIVDKHWGKYYVERDDLVQESMMTFWNALDRYDKTRSTPIISYIYSVVYMHLNTYVHRYRYGSIARTSSFQDAMRAVKYAKSNNESIDNTCDRLKLTKAKREYARILAKGDDLCASLSIKLSAKEECETELKDVIASDEDLADEICTRIDTERICSKLYDDFVDTEVENFRGNNKDNFRKAVIAFLDCIFVEPRTQCSLAKELGISRETIRKYFNRLQKNLKNYLLTNKMISEPISC